jgi:hypothetical protein
MFAILPAASGCQTHGWFADLLIGNASLTFSDGQFTENVFKIVSRLGDPCGNPCLHLPLPLSIKLVNAPKITQKPQS